MTPVMDGITLYLRPFICSHGGVLLPQIGVRELRAKASEILREVKDRNASYEITQRGKVIARLVPASEPLSPEEWLAQVDALAAEIEHYDEEPRSSVELVNEGRERW